MRIAHPVRVLQDQWSEFLEDRGHRVRDVGKAPGVLVSHSRRNNSFRWVLLASLGPIKVLTLSERRQLVGEIGRAHKEGQKIYVVVQFSVPESKLVIAPAGRLLKTGKIGSARGGLPWLD